ncbi:MAG: VCBS repeat-containing protein [Candidatus Hydrogenedentes bacterium]|nr:VCBS repeat-containing protein [Candidatus Hydrogenedentota bacterium]
MRPYVYAVILIMPAVWSTETTPVLGEAWARHVIDDTSRGADGVRLCDVNADGWKDIATSWEEGGVVRLYLHPDEEHVREPWPQVTAGNVSTPEDAVCADIDEDGAIDVITCTEGEDRSIYFHWGPLTPEAYLDASAWRTEALPAAAGYRQWMFALPVQVDGKYGIDLVAGSKNENAWLGWFEAPEDARDLDQWKWDPLRRAGWIMSLFNTDMDGDNNWDVVFSDRRGQQRGCWWLRHPGPEHLYETWKAFRMGGAQYEVMFMAPADLDADGSLEYVAATKAGPLVRCEKAPPEQQRVLEEMWLHEEIAMPENAGTGKAVAAGDIDNDGRQDLVVTCEHAEEKHGVFWLSYHSAQRWDTHAISGLDGVKFDLAVLEDLDFDGDLDVLTCEEKDNLGVVWYENPFGPGLGTLRLPPAATGGAPNAEVHEEAEGNVVDGKEQGQKNKGVIRRLLRLQ